MMKVILFIFISLSISLQATAFDDLSLSKMTSSHSHDGSPTSEDHSKDIENEVEDTDDFEEEFGLTRSFQLLSDRGQLIHEGGKLYKNPFLKQQTKPPRV